MSHVDFQHSALEYLPLHWSVIPLRPGSKRPLVRWQEFQHRRADSEQVRRWASHWPRANIGVVTGTISGLIVLDVDPQHGGDASLRELEQTHGKLPRTVAAVTGGGGHHLYFAHPGGLVRNQAGLRPGIDVRGDGGYVVAPPSVHASGKTYRWVRGAGPREVPLAAVPVWLYSAITGRRAPGRGHTVHHWRSVAAKGVPEGERNTTLASFVGHLLWHGVDAEVARELVLCWNAVRCQPPLPEEEVNRVVDSITRLHEEGRPGEAD